MKRSHLAFGGIALVAALLLSGCGRPGAQNQNVKSTSGVQQAQVHVQVGSDGRTVEQRNVVRRLKEDNLPGAVKHLYVIAPRSGQVLIYSTVDGKVTSSSKRLAPYTVAARDGKMVDNTYGGVPVTISGYTRRTSEVLQDDGTYGSSNPYIYWWDTKGIYHQHFFTDGQIIHVSSEPITVKGVVINMEVDQTKGK
jgi:hypothetical protein